MLKLLLLTFVCLLADQALARDVKKALVAQAIKNVLQFTSEESQLLGITYNGPFDAEETIARLPDNATLIVDDIVGGFDCSDRKYGYYADMNNNCQLFHVCFPLNDVFKGFFRDDDILHFIFVCPAFTRFTQDAMVCAWSHEAIPCEASEQLYHLNDGFFVIEDKDKKDKDKEKEKEKKLEEIRRNRFRSS